MSRKNNEKKEQQRQHVECLLESDLSVAEWCRRYGIAKQTMYAWISLFAKTEPALFGGQENIVDSSKRRWLESTRLNIKASRQLAVRPAAGVVIVDTLYEKPAPAEPHLRTATQPTETPHAISVSLSGACVSIPPGSDESDISAVLKAVAGL
jgi:transposase-like protein